MALRLSQEEFTRGVQTYSRDMYRAARALTPCDADAQDAVGQAVLLAWQSLDRLRDPEALRAWLVKISVNCARQLNRRSRREVYLEDLPPQAAAREDPRPELWDAVLSLPRDQRAAVHPRFQRVRHDPAGGGHCVAAAGAGGHGEIPAQPGPG